VIFFPFWCFSTQNWILKTFCIIKFCDRSHIDWTWIVFCFLSLGDSQDWRTATTLLVSHFVVAFKERVFASWFGSERKETRLKTQIGRLLRRSVSSAARCSGSLPAGRSLSGLRLAAFRVFSSRPRMTSLPEVVFVLGGPGSGKGTLCISVSEVSTLFVIERGKKRKLDSVSFFLVYLL
jgi:hypothetical protein